MAIYMRWLVYKYLIIGIKIHLIMALLVMATSFNEDGICVAFLY
jgi:uncharacterized membrane protein